MRRAPTEVGGGRIPQLQLEIGRGGWPQGLLTGTVAVTLTTPLCSLGTNMTSLQAHELQLAS